MDSILSSVITGVLALIGIIVSNILSNNKIAHQLDKSQALTDCKLDELTREVREHNDFAKRIPVIENEVEMLKQKIRDVEKAMAKISAP